MSITFSAHDAAHLSRRLYAEGFSLSDAEAAADLSALTLGGALPLTLSRGGEVLCQGLGIPLHVAGVRLLYLYALVTAPASRGQGLLRTLLRESLRMARDMSFSALCLLPATAALADAYRRMGFTERRPAGGAAAIWDASDLSYVLSAPPVYTEERDTAVLYPALGAHLPQKLFDFTLSTLAPTVMPVRTKNGFALLLRSDPRYALAVSEGLTAKRQAGGEHNLLLAPLDGRLPEYIPEPLPR